MTGHLRGDQRFCMAQTLLIVDVLIDKRWIIHTVTLFTHPNDIVVAPEFTQGQ